MPIGPHYYRALDKGSSLPLPEIPMRSVAERVESMNYGTHRFLSHLIDVRREQLAQRIADYRARGLDDVADSIQAQGDKLADGIEELLKAGLL